VVEDVRRALMEGQCSVPAMGSVDAGVAPNLPYVVVDAGGREVEPVSAYLRDLMLGDVSPDVPQLRVRAVAVAPPDLVPADRMGEGHGS
jgi:hypothetical protein